MTSFFKGRTLGFYLALVVSAAALIADMIYYITDRMDRTFSMVVFILVLVGAILILLNVIFRSVYAILPTALCFAAAAGIQLYTSLYTIMDIINEVNFYGGNHLYAVLYLALFVGTAVLLMITCFMKQSKV